MFDKFKRGLVNRAEPQSDLEPLRPEPVHEDPRDEVPVPTPPPATASGWADPTRLIATIITAASAVFTVWSVWDLATTGDATALTLHLAGLAGGLVVESGWVWLLAMAHKQATRTGRVNQWITVSGWVLAIVTAVILVAHGVQMESWGVGLLAVLPIIAKTGWHGLTTTRAEETRARLAAEEDARKAEETREKLQREAAEADAEADDTSFTVDQRQRLAQLKNEADFTEAEAEELRRLADVRARVQHKAEIAQIERAVEKGMVRLESVAELKVRRAELEERIELSAPLRSRPLALGSGGLFPDDASSLDSDGGTGFAAVMTNERMQASARTGSDQEVPKVPGGGAGAKVHPSVLEAVHNRAACAAAFARLLTETKETPSISVVATATNLSERAVGRHLRALELID